MAPSKTARLKVITDSVYEIVDLLVTGENEDIEAEELALSVALISQEKPNLKRKLNDAVDTDTATTNPTATFTDPDSEFANNSKEIAKKNIQKSYDRYRDLIIVINREMKQISDFADHFKMSKTTLEGICLSIGDAVTSQYSIMYGGKPSLSVVKQTILTVWLLVNQESFSNIAQRFKTSKSSALMSVRRVCNALVQVAGDVITWPSEAQVPEIEAYFEEKCGIPGIIGVLDAIHIRVRAMEALPEAYRNSEGLPSIILQATCDNNLLFTDCYAGLLGSHTKAEVYYASDLHQKVFNNSAEVFPDNSHLVADESYLIDQHLLTPYPQNFDVGSGEHVFNSCINKALEMSTLAFAHLKTRFSRLNNLVMSRVDLVPNVSVACVVLHNICIQSGDILDSNQIDMTVMGNTTKTSFTYDRESGQEINRQEGIDKRNAIKSAVYSWFE